MFQCLGLGTIENGGCGEDWYHPGCLVGMGPNWFEKMEKPQKGVKQETSDERNQLTVISEGNEDQQQPDQNGPQDSAIEEDGDDEVPMPPGFPDEDDFEAFLCYKCVDANPWIKRYAGTAGFLPALFANQAEQASETNIADEKDQKIDVSSRKRKAEDEEDGIETKRPKDAVATESPAEQTGLPSKDPSPIMAPQDSTTKEPLSCKLNNFPLAPRGQFSLFLKEYFLDSFCRCPSCYPLLNPHPQLLEEEEVYEPPLSDAGSQQDADGHSHGSGSLLERGESALRNVDRVRAIEGVMAYNHLKEQLKPFFQQFADSGQAIGAEDIKAYFAKLRGDEKGIQEAGEKAAEARGEGSGDGEGGGRKEQSGY